MRCNLKQKIVNWYKNQKSKPASPFALVIRDQETRRRFLQIELLAVKKRWEICTIFYVLMTILGALMSVGSSETFSELLGQTADCLVVFVALSLLGLKQPKVHRYSLVVLCVVRTLWIGTKVQLLYFQMEESPLCFITHSPDSYMTLGTIFIPAGMLFMLSFRYYVCYLLPLLCVSTIVLFVQAREIE